MEGAASERKGGLGREGVMVSVDEDRRAGDSHACPLARRQQRLARPSDDCTLGHKDSECAECPDSYPAASSITLSFPMV